MKDNVVTVIMTKNGTKYQVGVDKSISSLLNEIESCKSDFYTIVDTCSIRVSEIVSVEQYVLKDDSSEYSQENEEE